jgi:hypothetical protein
VKGTLAFSLLVILLLGASTALGQVPEAVALRTNRIITVDGKIDPNEWKGIKPIRVDLTNGLDTVDANISGDADLSYDLYLAHDGTTLYIGFDVNDETIITDSGTSTWDDDCVEIFCDADEQGTAQDNNKAGFQLLITSDARTDASDNASLDLSGTDWRATALTPDGFSVEVALPFTSFDTGGGTPLAIGDVIGFTVNVDDDDDGSTRDSQFWWYAVNGDSWNNQQDWAFLRISEKLASVTSAGPDQRVYGGSKVTLTGVGPDDATSFTWSQIAGMEHLQPSLQPSPNNKEVWFDAPVVTIGFVLTFELSVVSASEGTATDTMDVTILASNPPKLAPSNMRVYPLDEGPVGLGYRLEWTPVIDAEKYQIALKLGPQYIWLYTTTDSFYKFSAMAEGQMQTVLVRGENKFCVPASSDPTKHGLVSEEVTYTAMPNLALPASLAGEREPSAYVYAVKPATPAGLNNAQTDDNNDSNDQTPKAEDYWGYLWSQPYYFDQIVYYNGQFSGDGGWFTSLKVQYTNDGTTWTDTPITKIMPPYDFTNSAAGRRAFTRYDISIPILRATGIRIFGTPGGTFTYTSVGELEVFGDQTHGALIVQGIDGEFPEGGTVKLDGSYSFSARGAITSYKWEKVSGPDVTLQNANSSIATFPAPLVTADASFVFKLTAGDGTETLSDSDVRITVKNLKTTAVAGADRSVPDASQVTLDGSGSLTTSGSLSYLWTQTAGTTVGVTGKTTPTVTFTAPTLWAYSELLTFKLQVNDGLGQPDSVSSDEVTIEVVNSLTSPTYPVGTGYLKYLLHLGAYPGDRILGPLTIGADPLAAFGGQANVSPVPGEAYDFTGTGVTTTSNPMVWTPIFAANGLFGTENFAEFEQIYHVYVLSPEQRAARLHFRNDDELRIWNNAVLVASRDNWDNGAEQTQDFTLNKGVNSITIKFEEGTGGNNVALGITDQNNAAYTDVYYSLGPSFLIKDAYAVRDVDPCYQPGQVVPVKLSFRVNPAATPGSVSIREVLPPGFPPANVNAPGATVSGGAIVWTLSGSQVKNSVLSYSLTISQDMAQAVRFQGTVSFDTTTGDIFGDNTVYAVPTEPRYLAVEMLMAAHVTWSAPVEEGIAGYNVYRSVNGGTWDHIAQVSSPSYVDTAVSAGNTYSYSVSAIGMCGEEGPSSPPTVQATLPGTMTTREAEHFNYDGGKFPWTPSVTVAAIEAPSATVIGTPQQYDFYHPSTDGPTDRSYRPLDNTSTGVAIETALDYGTTDVYHTDIGSISVGSWYRYGFNVAKAGWIKLSFRVASPSEGTIAAYWDEAPVGTVSFSTGNSQLYTWAALEQFQEANIGEHHLRVALVGGQMNFDKIAIGFDWTPAKRETIWSDNFDTYNTDADVKAAGWTIENGSGYPDAAWRLWDTQGPPLGNQDPNLAGMYDKYMITDSDLAPDATLDERLVSKEVDCSNYMKVRLNFSKNYNAYDEPDHLQIAEVDIQAFNPTTGWGDWVNLLRWDRTNTTEINSKPEQVELSGYDGKKIRLRWHYSDAKWDYWFAIDEVRVSGEPLPAEKPKFTKVGKVGNAVALEWKAFGAGQYTVQQTDNLAGGTWTNAPGSWPIGAASWTSGDLSAVKKRYFRVLGQ